MARTIRSMNVKLVNDEEIIANTKEKSSKASAWHQHERRNSVRMERRATKHELRILRNLHSN